jgi:transposase
MYQDCIGIDIAKHHLDVFSPTRDKAWRIANQRDAIRSWLRALPREAFIVFEATSVYDRTLRTVLARAKRRFARVNPRRARAFARAAGLLAKTDRVDARMLAQLGAALEPRPTVEPSAAHRRLADLLQRRHQLVEMRKQEKTRRHQVDQADLRRDIASLIDVLSRRIAKLERAMAKLIRDTEALARRDRLLRTAPGVGPVTAATLIADMTELGTLDRRAIALLAGLAPIADDTGKRRGYRKISGGRRRVTRALYLAALAARMSPAFKPFHDRLLDKGRQPKAAIIAVARKLIVTLNAMARDDAPFEPNQA